MTFGKFALEALFTADGQDVVAHLDMQVILVQARHFEANENLVFVLVYITREDRSSPQALRWIGTPFLGHGVMFARLEPGHRPRCLLALTPSICPMRPLPNSWSFYKKSPRRSNAIKLRSCCAITTRATSLNVIWTPCKNPPIRHSNHPRTARTESTRRLATRARRQINFAAHHQNDELLQPRQQPMHSSPR